VNLSFSLETPLNNTNQPTGNRAGNRKTIGIIFCLLLAWSLLIGLGAMLRSEPFDFRKPLIVLGTMGAFLGVWLTAMLLNRRQSISRD
jgi:hypothetical protein